MTEVRSPLVYLEPLTEGNPSVRSPLVYVEPFTEGNPLIRVALVLLEALVLIEEELPVSTTPFPGFGNSVADPSIPQAKEPFNSSLPGLSFSVHKKPMFKTRISEAASGNEVRNSLTEFPRWEFTLPYEFLEDKTGAASSLKTLMGFFLSMKGSYDSWLFKDPDDYLVVNGFCGQADGLITVFSFYRGMGSFYERVGQVDSANAINLYLSIASSGAIPSMAPFTRTVANTVVEDLGVTKAGVPMTLVVGAPSAGQYSRSGTVYTFAAADNSATVIISYRYLLSPSLYTLTLPNKVTFTTAVPTGRLTADFQFYFVCRFIEDQADFEKFYDRLWALQECAFRSIIQ